MLQRARKPPLLHFPLRRLALCLDCDSCFEFGPSTCPACGSETLASLARFLQPASRLARGGKDDGDDADAAPEIEMPRQLFIVACDRPKLWEYAKRAFAGNPTVHVMLDRRTADRRRNRLARVPERRDGDRRRRDVSDHLRGLGWAIVAIDAGTDVERRRFARGRSAGAPRP